MPAYKNNETRTWYVMTQYTDWTGERKQKCKRGFATRREALEWERKFQQQSAGDLEKTFEAFVEIYTADLKARLKENTWLTKDNIIRKKILPYFSKRKINEITTKDVIAWQNELLIEYKKQERRREVETLENKVECTDKILSNRQQLLTDVETVIDKLEEEYADKKKAVGELETELSEKENELAETSAAVEENNALLAKSAEKKSKIKDIEAVHTKKTLLGDNVTLSRTDFESISDLAKKQIAADNNTAALKREITALKSEKQQLSEEKSELVKENTALKQELSSQKSVHIKIAMANMKSELEEMKRKYNKVMEFIESLGLKQKLLQFLHPKTHGVKR